MEVQTFKPTYQPKAEQKRATKNSTGQEFDYRRMRIRADLIQRLDSMKPADETLTVFINIALASFLNTRKISITTAQN